MAADVLKPNKVPLFANENINYQYHQPNKVPLFANENINYQYFEVCLRKTSFCFSKPL